MQRERTPVKLEYGKHKGKELKDIPPDYLVWIEEQKFIELTTMQDAMKKIGIPISSRRPDPKTETLVVHKQTKEQQDELAAAKAELVALQARYDLLEARLSDLLHEGVTI